MPDLEIKKGKTFSLPFRLETEPICRKAISAIDFSHGAPRITVSAHGIPDGWRVYCYGISGPVQLNAECPDHISDQDFHIATVIDGNTIEFNSINADGFKPYVSGGFVAFYSKLNLSGASFRAKIKDKIGGALLMSSEAADAPKNTIATTINADTGSVELSIPASVTASIAKRMVVIEAEIELSSGEVLQVMPVKTILVSDEVVV